MATRKITVPIDARLQRVGHLAIAGEKHDFSFRLLIARFQSGWAVLLFFPPVISTRGVILSVFVRIT